MEAAELLALYEAGERDFHGLNLENLKLINVDLSDINLRNANLRNADLSGANLSGADLSWINLSSADLSGTNLRNADLRNADLSAADLSAADLSGTDLSDADLSGADLSDADLSDADLSNADLRCADLSGANLIGIDLRNADLSDANLSSANLNGANLDLAILTGTLIDNETKLDHKWYLVWELINKKSKPREEKYDQLSLFKLNSFYNDYRLCRDLSNSCLKNLDLTGLNLSFSILYRADCKNTNFTNTNLYCANFHSADLRGANFTNADLRYAILIEANLEGADFTNADLRYINSHGVDLTYSKTEGAKFTTFDDISCSWNQLDDEQFELLCYDIIKEKHHPNEIHKIGKSRSRDGGRDIVFYKGADINKKPIRWIAQCKLKNDKGSLGSSQVTDIRDMLEAKEAKGFCVMTSGIIDATLHDKLNALIDKTGIEVER